jgi:hypothetical protein
MKYLNSFIILENKEFGNYCREKISFIEDHFIDLKDEYNLSIKHYWKEQFSIIFSQTDYNTWKKVNYELKNESDLKSASIFHEKRCKILKKLDNILTIMNNELKSFEVKFADDKIVISLEFKDICPVFINNTGSAYKIN